MPELGDIEGFRRIALRFAGAAVRDVAVIDASVLRNVDEAVVRSRLIGSALGVASRHGKWLTIPVGEVSLMFHFAMTGSLTSVTDQGDADRSARLSLDTDRGELRYVDRRRLGGAWIARSDAEWSEILGRTGPDVLSLSRSAFQDRLCSARGAIKAALMDQHRIAGIGNFGSDEILWRARIRPDIAPDSMSGDQWDVLYRATRSTLAATSRAGHTPRGPNWLTGARFDQDARCPRCSCRLQTGSVAGRTSVWCPHCQRPAAADEG